jgi:protein-disulfide isomerase
MLFSGTPIRPAYFLISALALSLAACGGASSDEAASGASAEDSDSANTGAQTGALAEMILGDADAPVTVVEYASVTCPHCATFHETVFPTIKENYIDTGKIRFIFREFPTSPAELSVVGSMLARCAADKGGTDAYFLVIDSLFKTQRTWIRGESPRNELIKIASQAGMTEADFDTCVKREELLDLINENISTARDKYNVNATPSFVIDGQLRNVSSVDTFSEALDAALEKAAK